MVAFTSARMLVARSSSVVYPSSSSRSRSNSSIATLIRSAGLFLAWAAFRIATAAIARARPASYFTP